MKPMDLGYSYERRLKRRNQSVYATLARSERLLMPKVFSNETREEFRELFCPGLLDEGRPCRACDRAELRASRTDTLDGLDGLASPGRASDCLLDH